MTSNKPTILIRTTDEIKSKITKIADENDRSVSKEIEHLIKEHIKEYEKYKGKIQVEE